VEQIKLSNNYSIYRFLYDGPYEKKDFLKRIEQNESLYFYDIDKKTNSLTMNIDCDEFKSIDRMVNIFFNETLNCQTEKIAKSSWIYTQIDTFNMDWMHTHEHLESSNRTTLKTQWTYVFYIQIPTDLKKGEGDIVFKTEDDVLHPFTPKENEILIFSGDLPHMAVPTKSSKTKRIVYATNVNFDFNYKNVNNKKIMFRNLIT
jgi:hypothetical protein